MRLAPGTPLAGLPIDIAYIGSCTNARLSDLRAAAAVLKGRKVKAGVTAVCVPGSTPVKHAAEAEGLDLEPGLALVGAEFGDESDAAAGLLDLKLVADGLPGARAG